MEVVCVAVVGRDNSPKYLACTNPNQELDFQYDVHKALDVVEEKLGNSGKSNIEFEHYLGVLYSTEKHMIYGYVTNTKVKFMIIISSNCNQLQKDTKNDARLRLMFRKIHDAYTRVVCNPFYVPDDNISSKYFDQYAKSILTVHGSRDDLMIH